MNTFKKTLVITTFATALYGCGGGSDSEPVTTPNDNNDNGVTEIANAMPSTGELQGRQFGSFQDAPVKGLTYWTASNLDFTQTGDTGDFAFDPGEVIALFIGNELMVLTDAEIYSTPMDVLSVRNITEPGKGHPHQALNVLRLLQTIDTTPDQNLITIPDSFHNDRNGSVLGLNFAQDTDDFANSPEVAAILTEAGKQGESLVSRQVAADHLEATLNGLENNVIDLRGTWVSKSTYIEGFGATPTESCVEVGPATWVVGDEDVFLYGDEIVSNGSGSGLNCNGRDYGSQDTSDWPGVSNETRNGIDGVTWKIADNGALDFDCGPECTLAELRGTIDDWEERCLIDGWYANNSEGDFIDQNDTDYCAESNIHNGPVVGYSEITYADRLGGDRIVRVKRDFYAPRAPAATAERGTTWIENGLALDVMNRKEALEHTVDLTTGSWDQKIISASSAQPMRGQTLQYPRDKDIVPLECANGFENCTWEELNSSYDVGGGEKMQFIHVRGTNIINWVYDDMVGTLTLND